MATALDTEIPIASSSPDTNSSDDTLPGEDSNRDGPVPSNETLSNFISAPATDLEAQNEKPARRTLLQSMGKLISSVTERIPDHWKAGHLNADRDKRQLDEYADGFPRFAAFMNCDDNFLMTRRYGGLHNRVMLFRQSRLRHLELELIKCDKTHEEDENESDALRDHKLFMEGEHGQYMVDLMKKIDGELEKYGEQSPAAICRRANRDNSDELVLRTRAMSSLPKASTRNYLSICNHFHNRAPLSRREQDIYMHDSDFVALVEPKESDSFHAFIEDLLTMLPYRLVQFLFSNAEQRVTTSDRMIVLYDDFRIDVVALLMITLLVVGLLLAPVTMLVLVQTSNAVKLVVVILSTLFFNLALSLVTRARRVEVFAATAAYCAVLVVFLGNTIPTSAAAT